MSQEGVVDIIGTHPEIPTLFIANVGFAIPIANTLELLGEVIANAGVPFESIGSGNTITYQIQRSVDSASSIANLAGIASFDSDFFDVDSNGFVTFTHSSITEAFVVDASTPPGTNPVVPNGSGLVTVTGGQVAAGTTTNVIRTDSLAANTFTIEVQRSQAVASSTIGDNGVSHFDSSQFTVDANGFVQITPDTLAYYSLTPYIVGPDIHSQFSDPQDAIDQAVIDGASGDTPANIYIKPGEYDTNLKIYDGINLIGFTEVPLGQLTSGTGQPGAFISGNITFDNLTSVRCHFSNLNLYNNGSGTLFTVENSNDISISLANCTANAQGSGKAFEITNTGTSLISCTNSTIGGVDGTINYHPTSPGNQFNIELNNSHLPGLVTLNDDSTSQCFFTAATTSLNAIAIVSSGYAELLNCDFSPDGSISSNLITISSGQRLIATGCTFRIAPLSGFPVGFYSSLGTFDQINCAVIDQSTANPIGYTTNHFPSTTGYNGSEVYQTQAQAHTTDDTVTTLFSVVVNELESITLSGTISAAKSDHTDSCGGNLIVTARRASGGNVTLVGVVIANVNSTSTATFTADVDTGTQTVRIRVTGIAATTYNWVSNINYQKVLTNA